MHETKLKIKKKKMTLAGEKKIEGVNLVFNKRISSTDKERKQVNSLVILTSEAFVANTPCLMCN